MITFYDVLLKNLNPVSDPGKPNEPLRVPQDFPDSSIEQLKRFCEYQSRDRSLPSGTTNTINFIKTKTDSLEKYFDWPPSETLKDLGCEFDLVILFGGGINSILALLHAIQVGYRRIGLLNVDCKFEHNKFEREVAGNIFFKKDWPNKFLKALGKNKGHSNIKLINDTIRTTGYDHGFYGIGYGQNLDGLNCLLVSVARYYCNNIYLTGSNVRRGEGDSLDNDPRFFNEMSYFLSLYSNKPVTVASPFSHWTKQKIIEWAVSILGEGAVFELMTDTISCHIGVRNFCGHCYPCFRKYHDLKPILKSFSLNKTVDDFPWGTNPMKSPNLKIFIEKEEAEKKGGGTS